MTRISWDNHFPFPKCPGCKKESRRYAHEYWIFSDQKWPYQNLPIRRKWLNISPPGTNSRIMYKFELSWWFLRLFFRSFKRFCINGIDILPWSDILDWQGKGRRWPVGFASRSACAQLVSIWPPKNIYSINSQLFLKKAKIFILPSVCPVSSWRSRLFSPCVVPTWPVQMSPSRGFLTDRSPRGLRCSKITGK